MSAYIEALSGSRSPLEALELALARESTGGKSKIEIDFRDAYPALERNLVQKMRKRVTMNHFNAAYKHGLTLAQFRKLLNAERERRREAGHQLVCENCGQQIPATAAAEQEVE